MRWNVHSMQRKSFCLTSLRLTTMAATNASKNVSNAATKIENVTMSMDVCVCIGISVCRGQLACDSVSISFSGWALLACLPPIIRFAFEWQTGLCIDHISIFIINKMPITPVWKCIYHTLSVRPDGIAHLRHRMLHFTCAQLDHFKMIGMSFPPFLYTNGKNVSFAMLFVAILFSLLLFRLVFLLLSSLLNANSNHINTMVWSRWAGITCTYWCHPTRL